MSSRWAHGDHSGHGSGAQWSRLGEVTAQSCRGHSSIRQHLQYDHGSVMARSQLNHGPGHGWLWPFWSPWAHGEQSRWPFFFSWVIFMKLANKLYIYLALFHMIIQSSAIVAQSSIARYYINDYRNWGRISIRCWTYKRHPIPHPNRRDMGYLLWISVTKLMAL